MAILVARARNSCGYFRCAPMNRSSRVIDVSIKPGAIHLNTATGPDSPWLFPGTRAGTHLHPNTIRNRIRALGVNLLGARNRALADLVTQVPPPVIADALGYSHQVPFKHAAHAAEPGARYAGRQR
jgi:hypothetical protein